MSPFFSFPPPSLPSPIRSPTYIIVTYAYMKEKKNFCLLPVR